MFAELLSSQCSGRARLFAAQEDTANGAPDDAPHFVANAAECFAGMDEMGAYASEAIEPIKHKVAA